MGSQDKTLLGKSTLDEEWYKSSQFKINNRYREILANMMGFRDRCTNEGHFGPIVQRCIGSKDESGKVPTEIYCENCDSVLALTYAGGDEVAYFDGIKIGDMVYTAMGLPFHVIEVRTHDFTVSTPIDGRYDIGMEGSCHGLGQLFFWQPPPKFDPPPRPKRKVKKEGWINIYNDDGLLVPEDYVHNNETDAREWCGTSGKVIHIEWEETE